jgi:hypothetical protein
MSYATAQALQAAIYQQLTGDPAVSDLIGGAVYDALPQGGIPPLYVLLGDDTVKDASDNSGGGAWHRFVISVVSDAAGFAAAKTAAGAVCDALVSADLALSRGSLVTLTFLKARALRVGTGDARRIDLTFRASVAD